ncbi:MAG: ACT domain-containing protein [Candidatus Thermoplasmatota archaeon]
MTYYEIVEIKEDGKVQFPADSAHEIGVTEGAYFLLEISPEVKEARLEHIALSGKKLVEIEFILENTPGVLSEISSKLAQHNVNILFNESEDVNPEEAVLVTVIDVSKMDTALKELTEELEKQDTIIEISAEMIG